MEQLLALPSLQGRCQVVAGHRGLDRRVRWVHVSELLDIARLLNGGEFLLTTGMLLARARPDRQRRFALDLAAQGAAGVGIELVRWMREAPPALVEACDAAGLPLVAIPEEVRFSTVAEEAARLLLYEPYSRWREVEEATSAMMARLAAGADAEGVLAELQRHLGHPAAVVLREGRVVSSAPGWPPDPLRRALVEASAQALGQPEPQRGPHHFVAGPGGGRVAGGEPAGWMGVPVVVRGRCRGVAWVPVDGGARADPVASILADRVAMCVATALLHGGQRQTLLREAGDDPVELVLAPHAHESWVRQRLQLLGAEPAAWTTVAVLRTGPRWSGRPTEAAPEVGGEELAACVRWLEAAVREEMGRSPGGGAPAARLLAVSTRVESVRVIATAPDRRALDAFLRQLLTRLWSEAEARFGDATAVFVGFGRPRPRLGGLHACYREALAVCDQQARGRASAFSCSFEDLSLGRLMSSFGKGSLRGFVEQELGPVVRLPERRREGLMAALAALVEANFNVAMAARRLHLRRQSLYRRLQELDELLPGFRAESPDRRAALVVALRAWQLLQAEAPAEGDEVTGEEGPLGEQPA